MYLCSSKIKYKTVMEYFVEDLENLEANEPQVQYGASSKKTFRTVSDEELSECITLEEWETELTKMIHEHYQSNK